MTLIGSELGLCHPATKLVALVTLTVAAFAHGPVASALYCVVLLAIALVCLSKGMVFTSPVVGIPVIFLVLVTTLPTTLDELAVALGFAITLFTVILGSSLFGLWFKPSDALLLAHWLSSDPRVSRCALAVIKALPTFTHAVSDVVQASDGRGYRITLANVLSFRALRALIVPIMVRLTRDVLRLWLDVVMWTADMSYIVRPRFRAMDYGVVVACFLWLTVPYLVSAAGTSA